MIGRPPCGGLWPALLCAVMTVRSAAAIADEPPPVRSTAPEPPSTDTTPSTAPGPPATDNTPPANVTPVPTHSQATGPLDTKWSGYVQAQFVTNQLSEDEITPDATSLNQDRFTLRRARLKVARDFRFAHAEIEIDANTVRGPAVDGRHAFVTLFVPTQNALPTPAAVTVGLFDVPFGAELTEGNKDRVLMERTAASRAFFAGEPDVGVQASGALGPFRYALAGVNGVPVGDNPSVSVAPLLSEKTFTGRLGAAIGAPEHVAFAGGVSFLSGQGLHVGTPATKPSLTWSDSNQDGFVTLDELEGVPGQAATPSVVFHRWALDADLALVIHTPAGQTRVFGEATVATNLDRTFFVADPVSTGHDVREVGYSAGFTQEITRYAVAGLRVDRYDPASDAFDARRGGFYPLDTSLLTISPVVAGQIPELGRLLVQYDHVVDHLNRDVTGAPADLPNDQWTIRVQGEF